MGSRKSQQGSALLPQEGGMEDLEVQQQLQHVNSFLNSHSLGGNMRPLQIRIIKNIYLMTH